MGIRARLFLLIALTLLPMLLLLAWTSIKRYQTRRDQALATELEVAQGVATTFRAYVNDVRRQNHTVGQAITTFSTFTEAKARRVLSEAAKQYPSVRNMSWVGADGRVLASSEPRMVGRSLAERPYVKQVLAGAPWAIGDLAPCGLVTQSPTLALATAIRNERGMLLGVVVAGIEPTRLGEITMTQQRPAGGAYAIFDRQGMLVYRSLTPPLSWRQRVAWREEDRLLGGVLATGRPQTGRVQLSAPGVGGEWMSARAPIGDLGWVAGAGRRTEMALAPVRRDLMQDLLMGLAALAGGFSLAALIARTIAGPLSRLEREASALDAGQDVAIRREADAVAPTEVRSLRATVAAMASGMMERAKALRENDKLRRVALEAAELGAWTYTFADDRWELDGRAQKLYHTGAPVARHDEGTIRALLHADDIEPMWQCIRTACAGDGHYRCDYRIRQPEGGWRWLRAWGQVDFEGEGPERRAVRMTGATRDVTVEKEAEAALKESESTLRSYYESAAMLMGIVELNERDEIIHIYDNPATARFFRTDPAHTAGQNAGELGAPAEAVNEWVKHYRQSEAQGRTVGFEYIHPSPHEPRWLAAHVAPIGRGPTGRMRFSYVAEDITQRKQTAEALRASEERYRLVSQATSDVIWDWDLTRNELFWNETLETTFGYAPDETPHTLDWWADQIHPEDRERIVSSLHAVIDSPAGRFWTAEYRFRHKQGHWVSVLDRGLAARDEQGRGVRMIGSMLDLTERKRAEEALRAANGALSEANAKLAEADRRKDEFLAMLAHELRNPLAPIRNAVQIMRIAGSGDPVLQRQRAIVDRQVGHMARLLDDLLEVSRVTRGKITLQRRRLNLNEVLIHALETAKPTIEARRHTLEYIAPPEGLCVEGDGDRLAQVVGNLLTNAAKYTEEGGRIWLEGSRRNGEAVIAVRDTGMGIAPEMQGRVFDLFTQADRTLDRSQGGLGIGLTMVKRLTEMHGGAVAVDSEGLGKGAVFTVRLPALCDEAADEEAEPAVAHQGKHAAIGSTCRVLVVDDVADSAASLAELLEIWSHKTRVACDGASALKAAESFRPNVALLDIGMPGMNGFELARRLRAEHGREIFLVALTGYGQSQDREATREAGFDAHLVKPVDLKTLSDLLARRAA